MTAHNTLIILQGSDVSSITEEHGSLPRSLKLGLDACSMNIHDKHCEKHCTHHGVLYCNDLVLHLVLPTKAHAFNRAGTKCALLTVVS